jgi:hypothetical protein
MWHIHLGEMVPLAIKWVDSLTLGDSIVGAGTLLLALFTYRLGRATYALDTRVATRERQRREREVRGAARLVDGELFVIGATLSHATEMQRWLLMMPTPRGAWDRDGALIAETLPEDEVQAIVTFFSSLTAWESVVRTYREENPVADAFPFEETERSVLANLSARLVEARKHVVALAYPDARDFPIDLDDYLAYRRERRRAMLRRLLPLRWSP